VPARYQRDPRHLAPQTYPTDSRYTLQWIIKPKTNAIRDRLPNNSDAAFKNHELPKPADILLHYNYGAAVVKKWGKNTDVLANRPDIPRPPVPAPALMGPPRAKHDRRVSIDKRTAATSQGGQGSGSKRRRGDDGTADLEVQDRWDEDDVILFLWGNTTAALERHAQKEQERSGYLENWRATVTGIPDVV